MSDAPCTKLAFWQIFLTNYVPLHANPGQICQKIYVPPPVTLELLRVRPALEPETEGSPPDGTPADKVEVTVELFGIPLPPPPLPPLEWSGNLSRSQRTEPEKEGIFYIGI